MNIEPEDLIPKLPKPRDLMPFPCVQSLYFKGHSSFVRTISISPCGQWLASGLPTIPLLFITITEYKNTPKLVCHVGSLCLGSDDKTLRLWEVHTTRCMKSIKFDDVIRSVAWNPDPALSLIAVACGNDVILVNCPVCDRLVQSKTDEYVSSARQTAAERDEELTSQMPATWHEPSVAERTNQWRARVEHAHQVQQVTWHGAGDYFAATLKGSGSAGVVIHQLSKQRSQVPLKREKGLVQCVRFHPVRPLFFVAVSSLVTLNNAASPSNNHSSPFS